MSLHGMSVRVMTRWSFVFGVIAALIATFVATFVFSSEAFAADLTWGGEYRIEAVRITNPELSSANSNKAYLLHHLVLTPKIIAADGLTVFSRLDVLNGSGISNGAVDNVAGDVLGHGPGTGHAATTDASNAKTGTSSNVFSRSSNAGTIAVTELYTSWAQEFGQLVVGRAPVQFGLGTAYSAGNGLFDHYIDTKDMVGYKIVMGNLFFFPVIGKVNEGTVGEEDDVNDYILQMQYDNPETDLSLGLLYQTRVYTYAGNDAPAGVQTGLGDATAVRKDGGKNNLIALFAKEKAGHFNIGVEADLLSGDTGLQQTSTGRNVGLNAYGIAAEVGWKPESSKLTGMFKFGVASGDDPGTTDTYEGYSFSRNYDVALLLFNHPLGQKDFMRTGLVRDTSKAVNTQLDNEAISNAIYFAPSLQYQWKDHYSYGGTFVYAMLNKDPIGGGLGTSTNLGWELDFNLTYKPYDRFTWITEAGFLLPGTAWQAGSTGLENKLAYGLVTKAAINF